MIATGLLDVLVNEITPNPYEVMVQLLPVICSVDDASVDSKWKGIHFCEETNA